MFRCTRPPASVAIVMLLTMCLLSTNVECGFYKWVSDAMGWPEESKGFTFGIKSKGMTAIIPFPMPIPIFSKEKKKEDDGGGSKGGKEDWEQPSGGGNDWWK